MNITRAQVFSATTEGNKRNTVMDIHIIEV
jgi:hypothetical protein